MSETHVITDLPEQKAPMSNRRKAVIAAVTSVVAAGVVLALRNRNSEDGETSVTD